MTAMARGDSASADPINGTRGKSTIHDRKLAFLNQITRPDYRSLPTSAATSQSSVPSTPVSIPLKINGDEHLLFREFGAPIATPEDEELLDDLEIKSEPVLSPHRAYTVFDERRDSEEKENYQNPVESDDTEADTTIREDIEEDEKMNASEIAENCSAVVEVLIEKKEPLCEPSHPYLEVNQNKMDFIRMVESAPELTNPYRTGDKQNESQPKATKNGTSLKEETEAEEMRKLTESFGEPRIAVLERIYVEETDDDETETETETENEDMDEDEVDEDVRRQIAAVSDDPMVFGWSGKASKEKMTKPTSLPLRYDVEEDCSTPRKAEFTINPQEEEPTDDATQSCSSADESVLQQSLLQLQKQLRKTDVRCSRLEKICEFQQRDIDSLRFEVDWKDQRIEYLQKTLQEMELSAHTDSTSSRSTSTS